MRKDKTPWLSRRKLSRFSLKQTEALEAFHALKNTPEFFRRYLERFMTHADLGGAAALEHTLEHVFNDREFAQTWARLLPADQEVLKSLANDVDGPSLGENIASHRNGARP